jgi:hypothetical protein
VGDDRCEGCEQSADLLELKEVQARPRADVEPRVPRTLGIVAESGLNEARKSPKDPTRCWPAGARPVRERQERPGHSEGPIHRAAPDGQTGAVGAMLLLGTSTAGLTTGEWPERWAAGSAAP